MGAARLPRVTAVAPGGDSTLVVTWDGTVWAWGLNVGGQLGDGTMERRTTPIRADRYLCPHR